MKKVCLFMTLSVCASVALAGCGLVPAQAPPSGEGTLEGTPWSLDSYLNDQGDLVDVLADTEVTAQFEAGEIGGSAGCNRYFGSYEIEGDKLTIGPLGSTEMYCLPDEVMEQERGFLAALSGAASYRIEGEGLEIANSEGETVLVFGVAEPTPLTGTTWQALHYFDGQDAVVSVLLGTEIVAVFDEEGTVSGSAGCNQYTASYELDDGQITVGPSAVTRMMFAEPEGIMEQEAAYLAAMESAVSYRTEGDQLELLDAEGRRAVSYIAAPEQGPGLTEDTLGNMVYQSEWTESGLAPLVDGEYREQAAPGSATEIVVLLTEHIAFGQLGGQEAAAVILVTNPGGSGTFYDLAVVVEQGSQPVHVTTTLLGDRAQINSLSIEDGEIIVDMITHGPDDPMCCPTQQVVQTYELRDGELVQTSEEVLSAAMESEIVGVVWRWVKFLGGDDTTIIVDDPDKYTLELLPNGQVSIQADCNRALGTYTLDGASGLNLELGPTTLAECEPGSLYDKYLELLPWIRTYVLQGDQLVLNMMADGGDLFFGRADPS
jgi:heat shock protein HslJ